MKPVMQTHFGIPAGNCWEACIASILEIDLDEIPYVRTTAQARLNAVQEYLFHNHGLISMACASLRLVGSELVVPGHHGRYADYFDTASADLCRDLRLIDGHYMIGGTNARGVLHVVVGKGGEIVHNPNPHEWGRLVDVDGFEFLMPVVRWDPQVLPFNDRSSYGGWRQDGEAPDRDELIWLCHQAVVPHDRWHDRGSANAQLGVGKLRQLLEAGCEFRVVMSPEDEHGLRVSDENTWWVEVTYRGFRTFDVGDCPETDTFYLPTWKRLQEREGGDWY